MCSSRRFTSSTRNPQQAHHQRGCSDWVNCCSLHFQVAWFYLRTHLALPLSAHYFWNEKFLWKERQAACLSWRNAAPLHLHGFKTPSMPPVIVWGREEVTGFSLHCAEKLFPFMLSTLNIMSPGEIKSRSERWMSEEVYRRSEARGKNTMMLWKVRLLLVLEDHCKLNCFQDNH